MQKKEFGNSSRQDNVIPNINDTCKPKLTLQARNNCFNSGPHSFTFNPPKSLKYGGGEVSQATGVSNEHSVS